MKALEQGWMTSTYAFYYYWCMTDASSFVIQKTPISLHLQRPKAL